MTLLLATEKSSISGITFDKMFLDEYRNIELIKVRDADCIVKFFQFFCLVNNVVFFFIWVSKNIACKKQ